MRSIRVRKKRAWIECAAPHGRCLDRTAGDLRAMVRDGATRGRSGNASAHTARSVARSSRDCGVAGTAADLRRAVRGFGAARFMGRSMWRVRAGDVLVTRRRPVFFPAVIRCGLCGNRSTRPRALGRCSRLPIPCAPFRLAGARSGRFPSRAECVLVPAFAGELERHFGIGAEREHLLAALELVSEAPPLRAVRVHQDEQTILDEQSNPRAAACRPSPWASRCESGCRSGSWGAPRVTRPKHDSHLVTLPAKLPAASAGCTRTLADDKKRRPTKNPAKCGAS